MGTPNGSITPQGTGTLTGMGFYITLCTVHSTQAGDGEPLFSIVLILVSVPVCSQSHAVCMSHNIVAVRFISTGIKMCVDFEQVTMSLQGSVVRFWLYKMSPKHQQ